MQNVRTAIRTSVTDYKSYRVSFLNPIRMSFGRYEIRLRYEMKGCFQPGLTVYYDFEVDLRKKVSFEGNIYVIGQLQGKGLGRKLVETREAICRKLGIEKIIINDNRDEGFWFHLGYKSIRKEELKVLERIGIDVYNRYDPPVMKILK